MTDYDEGGLGALRVGLSADPGCPELSQIRLLNILGHARIYVFYISLRGRVASEAQVVFQCPLIEEFQGSKMSSI